MDSSGHTISSTTTIVPNLVIDTVGPKVTSVAFNRFQGQIVVTFQDYGGLNNAGVGPERGERDRRQQLPARHGAPPPRRQVPGERHLRRPGHDQRDADRHPVDQRGPYIKGGWYFFTIYSASPTRSERRPGHRRQRARRRVLRVLPLGEQRPRRQLRRPAHRDPSHDLRPLDGRSAARRRSALRVRGRATSPIRGRSTRASCPIRSASASGRRRPSKAAVKLVHHSNPALTHLIKQVGSPIGRDRDRRLVEQPGHRYGGPRHPRPGPGRTRCAQASQVVRPQPSDPGLTQPRAPLAALGDRDPAMPGRHLWPRPLRCVRVWDGRCLRRLGGMSRPVRP